MAIRVLGGDELIEFGRIVRTIPVVLDTNRNIGEVIKASHAAAAKEFVSYMTKIAVSAPEIYKHMYEWNQVGVPTAKLWKHTLRGAGRSRQAYFEFLPSKSIVPVHPKLAAVGVKKRHRFAMKAPVMEYGLKVSISPRIAKALVYLAKGKGADTGSSVTGKRWVRDGVVYHPGTVNIERAGNANIWGAFTAAYVDWWSGAGARIAIEEKVVKKMTVTISEKTKARLLKVGGKVPKVPTKSGSISMQAIDPELETKLVKALYNDYDAEILNRTT